MFFNKSFGCCRYVYNWALQKRIEAYQSDGIKLTAIDLCKLLPNLKKMEDTYWLNEVSSVSFYLIIKILQTIFWNQ